MPEGTHDKGRDWNEPAPASSNNSENLGEELLGAILLRIIDHVGGSTRLDDHAAVHEDHLIGDLSGKPDLVSDHGIVMPDAARSFMT